MMVYAFWISIGFVVYTYMLYPLIILILSRIKHRSPVSEITDSLPSIALIIIAYNEERCILEKIENCRGLDYPKELLTVCIVSDGSTDRTGELLRTQDGILSIEDDVNQGKPHQINRAVRETESDIIAFSDARQTFEPDALKKLVRNFSDPSVGVVSGELVFRAPSDHTGSNIGLYWRYEKMLRKAESKVDSTMGVTGAIYAIRRVFFAPIPDDTILDDIEIPLGAFNKGYRVTLDSDAVAYDTPSTEIGLEFSRKVRTLAGNYQLFNRNLWLLNPFRNRIFFQTVSHKIFRLMVPYFLLSLLIASALLDGLPYLLFFIVQLLFYVLGIIGIAINGLRANRFINFIAVFIILNTAAVCALYRYTFNKMDIRWRKQTSPL